jgi:hypothetical protein
MTLEKTLLRKVPEWRPAPHERETLAVVADDGKWCARLTADRCEDLGVALWNLRLERMDSPLALAHEQLTAWAQRFVQLPGVLDPLTVVEIDKARGCAQLRSALPTARDGKQLYYEVLLSRTGQVNVNRYQAGRTEREETVFVLTHENLGRLASLLTEAACDQQNLS